MEEFSNYQPKEELSNDILQSIFRTSKKIIQEYVVEIERNCRYKSARSDLSRGVILDDRARFIDLYEACIQQDAHLSSVLETLESQILGERYMLARQTTSGQFIKDVEETKKIQGSQFVKIIKGVVESKLFGYTCIELNNGINPITGKLREVNIIERRNVLPDQKVVVQRQGIWNPHWELESPQYRNNYILVNTGDIGLFSRTTPLILAKKFTFANYVNFAQTYALPIIHGKTEGANPTDRSRLARDISNASQHRVIVTGINDDIDVKAFTMSNSEKIYMSLINSVNSEVSNLILGSESMAGATQSYVGSTKAHQDIFRDRVEVYREYIENTINEEIIPRLVFMGMIRPGLTFKYANKIEMNNADRIDLYRFLTDRYEIAPEEIEKEFGIIVNRQLNLQGKSEKVNFQKGE